MDLLRKVFPYSFRIKENDVASLIINILVHLAVGIVAGILIGVLKIIPFIGLIFSIAGALVDLYILAGIVITVLNYTKVLK